MPTEPLKAYLSKAAKYCASQERAPSQVRQKLQGWGTPDYLIEEVLNELVRMDFLNENRFCRAYCLDKFRFNKWGKTKIRQYLRQLGIDEGVIGKGLDEIPQVDYKNTITKLIESKKRQLGAELETPAGRQKLVRYLLQKGFGFESFSEFI